MALISRKLLTARPQELGKIKIGLKGDLVRSKKGTEFRPPQKVDHFIVTTRARGDDENFIRDERIHSHPDVGERPTELAGVLMFERPEDNFHAEMVIYRGRGNKGKVWSCDGEQAKNLETGEANECVKARGGKCQCKPYSRLHLQLWASPNFMGYHVFRTTSWESTNNIQTALEEIYARFGTCYQAPVKLVLYPSEDRHDNGVSTSYKVGLVLAMSLRQAAERMGEARGYLSVAQGTVRSLAAGVQEDLAERDDEEEVDIAEEYFPPEPTEIARTMAADALDSPDEPAEAAKPSPGAVNLDALDAEDAEDEPPPNEWGDVDHGELPF